MEFFTKKECSTTFLFFEYKDLEWRNIHIGYLLEKKLLIVPLVTFQIYSFSFAFNFTGRKMLKITRLRIILS